MEFVLNEKSLDGQFESVEAFLKSIENNVKCFHIIEADGNNRISKTQNFYECAVTSDEKIRDLRAYKCADVLFDFELKLEQVIYSLPHWDENPAHDLSAVYMYEGEDVTATGMAEAAEKDRVLISFALDKYIDRELTVYKNLDAASIYSIYSPRYLVETVGSRLNLSRDDMLKIRYQNTRIDCSTIEHRFGAEQLEKDEFAEVISSMDKFVSHESWDTIAIDDGLKYKKYTPNSSKNNWFTGSMYQQKTIMKFRAGSVLRIFGYRKGDRFKVLRIERDHVHSNHG